MHPAVNQLSRAMSSLSSVARTALSITNALNLASLAFNSTSVSLTEIQADLVQKQRELALAIRKYGEDSIEVAGIQEEINVLLAKQNEEAKRLADQQLQNAITLGAAIALIGKSAFDIATKIGPHIGTIKAALTSLGGVVSQVFANPVTGQGLAFAVAQLLDYIPGMKELKQNFSDWLHTWAELDLSFIDTAVENFFSNDLPNALSNARVAFDEFAIFTAKFFLEDLPAWVTFGLEFLRDMFITTWNTVVGTTNKAINGIISGIESLANSFINVINRMIRAYNSVAGKIGLGKLSTVGAISLPRINIPTIAAATGFDGVVNGPTYFLAGEAGPESVSIAPLGRTGGSAGGGLTVIVQGLITEHQLYAMFDDYLKNQLKSRGFGT